MPVERKLLEKSRRTCARGEWWVMEWVGSEYVEYIYKNATMRTSKKMVEKKIAE